MRWKTASIKAGIYDIPVRSGLKSPSFHQGWLKKKVFIKIGFVFQTVCLLWNFAAAETVAKPNDSFRDVMEAFRTPRLFPLRVIVKGNGIVASTPGGLECSNGVCFAKFPKNTVVTLTAIPGNDQMFNHWRGACQGAETCTVELKRPRTVVAQFDASPSSRQVYPSSP